MWWNALGDVALLLQRIMGDVGARFQNWGGMCGIEKGDISGCAVSIFYLFIVISI